MAKTMGGGDDGDTQRHGPGARRSYPMPGIRPGIG
jgi:hypothetical protein